MNGPQHYAEATRLADVVARIDRAITRPQDIDPPLPAAYGDTLARSVELVLQRAQVHATLALAAATADPIVRRQLGDDPGDDRAWADVTAPAADRTPKAAV